MSGSGRSIRAGRDLGASSAGSSDGSWRRTACWTRCSSGPRLDPQLVEEGAARVPEDVEGLRLPAVPVERDHQLPLEPLPERLGDDERAELRDQFGARPASELRVEPILDRGEAKLLQPVDLCAGEREEGELLE
ncbi:MAG TPA: hypothetical protein VNI55_08255 [Gaiellaceae bacterium]|nr:hypothetical protein [Gaiellaceae bacterium]